MSREKVWIEAYENYAIQKYADDTFTVHPDKIRKMPDDELRDYVFEEVHRQGLDDDFKKYVHEYCMTYK